MPVKDVGKFGAKLQPHAFLYLEKPRQGRIFHRAPLLPVVGVIRSRSSELSGRRIRPCIAIKYERLSRIEAMAIEILSKQRHTGNARRIRRRAQQHR